MKAPPGEYPKEKMILDHIVRVVGEHRKVLLLCQQTETLDITKEWMTMLSERGIKGRVLRCEPNEREAWIAKAEAEGVEVIISHPRRVATGLDILGFPEIIWMGTEFSAYTMAQASRRSWRIGQTKPVQVTFYAYDETMQEKALMLMANKMAAIQQIDGNAVSDDTLADIADVGDVYTILAQSLIKEGEAVSTVEELFQTAHTGWLEEGEVATTLFEQKEAWGYIGQYDPDQVEADATAISANPTPSTEELEGMSTLFGVTKPAEAEATTELTSASSAESAKPVKWTLADMIRAKNKK